MLLTDEARVEMFSTETCQHKHFKPTVKYGGEEVKIWSRFAAPGAGHLALFKSTTSSCAYLCALEGNMICTTVNAWSKLGHATGE